MRTTLYKYTIYISINKNNVYNLSLSSRLELNNNVKGKINASLEVIIIV